MVDTGVLFAEAERVTMVRASSCSSSSMASLRPSLPFQVLKRLAEGRDLEEAVEGERLIELTHSSWPSSETGTSRERPMY